MKKTSLTNLIKKLFSLTVTAICCQATIAQQQINNPEDLKMACENSPGNVVTLNQSTKVSLPVQTSTPVQVNCGCTVILTNEAKLEFEQSSMQFAGPFVVQSTGKGEVNFTNSLHSAQSFAVNFSATGSGFTTSQSQVKAIAGNLTITLGQQAKMEVYGSYSRSVIDGLSATGIVNISAGERFTGSIADMVVRGNQGIQINSTGFEGLLKLEKTSFFSTTGSVKINAAGDKSSLEGTEIFFNSFVESSIILSGNETGIKLNEVGFYGATYGVPSTGGVTIKAAIGAASMGKIEMAEIRADNIGGSFTASAAVNRTSGGVKLEKSVLNVKGAITFETGTLGSTEVKENRITSQNSITIKTGSDGSCVSSPNFTLSAPSVQACVGTTRYISPNNNNITKNILPVNNVINVFPNPGVNGQININFENGTDTRDIAIINCNGKIVKEFSNFKNTHLVINALQAGFYNLQITNRTTLESSSKKIIIAN